MRMYSRIQEKKHHNNLGFSLLELMITVAVMAVMLGAGLTTYATVSRNNVKKATRYIDDNLSIAREKAKTIAAYEWNMTINASGDSVYVEVIKVTKVNDATFEKTVVNRNQLPSNVKVRILDSDNNIIHIGNGSGDYKYASIVFSPLKGSVSKIYFDEDRNNFMILSGGACDIEAYYGNKKSKSVRIYFTTGKHSEV